MYDVWRSLEGPVVNPTMVKEAMLKAKEKGAVWDAGAWSIIDRAITIDPAVMVTPEEYFQLAAALAHAQLGRMDEARSAVKTGLALNPAYTISRARDTRTARSDDPTYLAQLKPIVDGLRKAGLPEE